MISNGVVVAGKCVKVVTVVIMAMFGEQRFDTCMSTKLNDCY